MANYDLSQFVEEQSRKKGFITLGKDHKYEIKCNAWSFLRLQAINEKFKGDNEAIGKQVVEIFLGKKALEYIESNVNVAGKEQVVAIIVTHVMQIDMSKKQTKK